ADANAVINYAHLKRIAVAFHFDHDERIGAVRVVVELDGVVDEVFQDDTDKFLVRVEDDVFFNLLFDGEAWWQTAFPFEHDDVVNDLCKVDEFVAGRRIVDLVYDQKPGEDGIQFLCSCVELVEIVECEGILHVHDSNVAHALEAGERTADIVG